MISSLILHYFSSRNEVPREVITNAELNLDVLSDVVATKFLTVTKGDKKKLLDMAITNAKINLENNFEIIQHDIASELVVQIRLENLLNMKINRIDCFDNSNLFGDFLFRGWSSSRMEFQVKTIIESLKSVSI